MRSRVYIETTIPSYLTAWASRDLVRAGHQQITREWWAHRDAFDIYVSRLVVEECRSGDAQAAADRLAVLAGLPFLAEDNATAALTRVLHFPRSWWVGKAAPSGRFAMMLVTKPHQAIARRGRSWISLLPACPGC